MEAPRSEIVYPTLDQIVDVNRQMLDQSGGYFVPPDNLRNRNSLEYILAAIANPVFGTNIFITPTEKAAGLAHEIITAHVFFDGNKRTGMHMAWEFLRSNGVNIRLDPSVEDLADSIARRASNRDDLVRWLLNRQNP